MIYHVRIKCTHDSGWHYVKDEQEELSENITCPDHEGSSITDFVLEHIEEQV